MPNSNEDSENNNCKIEKAEAIINEGTMEEAIINEGTMENCSKKMEANINQENIYSAQSQVCLNNNFDGYFFENYLFNNQNNSTLLYLNSMLKEFAYYQMICSLRTSLPFFGYSMDLIKRNNN